MKSVSIISKENLGQVEEELSYESIEELAAIISTHQWAPGLFHQSHRSINCFRSLDVLALDVDSGFTLLEACEEFKEYRHIIATSRSHQKEKKGLVCDRFRVILFLNERVFGDPEYKATWERAKQIWNFIDPACKDASRFFYPSPTIVSINRKGREFVVTTIVDPDRDQKSRKEALLVNDPAQDQRGDLWKSTLDLLLNGAPSGTRHLRLVTAVANLKEQNYTLPEALAKLQDMAERVSDWTQVGLSPVDIKTIERVYARETKHPFKSVEQNQIGPSPIVNANELLDEMFAYLADKDRVKGEPTGIDGLDKLLGGGAREGEITVLMARAKTGKNTLYHHMMYSRLQRGVAIGYASRELDPASEVMPNLLSIAMQQNAWNSSIDGTYQDRARQAIISWQLYFAPGYGYFPLEEMERWFELCVDQGVKHFVFDHFHHALLSEDHESTASLIKALKSCTKRLKIHLDLIVQPRGLREGEIMSLATLRGGAVIGQALDNLLIFERVKGETNISKLTLEVARHKLAEPGAIYLKYDKDTTSFEEVEKSQVIETPENMGMGKFGNKSWPRVN